MAVPHSYHCAPDQLHGGDAGKDVPAFTAAATVYILPWECCSRGIALHEKFMCQQKNIICYYSSLGKELFRMLVCLKVWCINQHYMLQ